MGQGNQNGRYHSGDLGVDGRLILKWIIKKYGLSMWTEII
jgi:hypothetical protein